MSHFLRKIPFMLLVLASLLTGILTGWFRAGFNIPALGGLYLDHAAIMTGSFLGTVILIERIVAMKKIYLFAFPIINASSLIFYFLNLEEIAFLCLIIGALGLFYVFFLINKKHSDLPHQIMWAGTAAWLIGNVHLLIFHGYAHSILWWMAFLLLTIVGERLELSRFLPISSTKRKALVFLLFVFLISCILPFHLGGQMLTGITLLLIAFWLMFYDMARKSVKKPGVHRFSAIALFFGYGWLVLSGLLFILNDTGFISYDSLIHSFFLGFVFSMIFAHAPIILPGVLGINYKPFHSSLYLWVLLFQLSLIIRIVGGMFRFPLWKQYASLANGILILCFILNLMLLLIINRRHYLQKS